mmetsp:Transcript_25121/g.43992  ORF Transcript_25121/g.43992 Transcript_25121/m.43992 type:complete len:533 (+) Transcript_25121:144-1742(+)
MTCPSFLLFLLVLASGLPHLLIHGQDIPSSSSLVSPAFFFSDWTSSTNTSSSSSCASLTSCENCTNTYTCHWCERTESCHARGSVYGCSWGSTCHHKKPPNKENSTCASHTTCSECALASHLCHWCEHDNACHAIGSRYGCTVGVDCYSNDRCRRTKAEPLPGGFFVTEISTLGLVVVLTIGALLVVCFTCCHYFTTNVKGAYDDLATITMQASTIAPMSVVGGPNGQFYTTLETHPEEESMANADGGNSAAEQNSQPQDVNSALATDGNSQQQQRRDEEANELQQDSAQPTLSDDAEHPYALMDDPATAAAAAVQESRPLLHPSYNGSVVGAMEESRHMKRLYNCCSIIYFVSVALVLALMGVVIFYYPKKPVYNVCNDAVAWKKIMANIAAFKIDASFEILISLSNPNHLDAALDRGKGSFSFQGKQVGTFEIPPATADAMAINDLMLITHVSPDRQQAIELAEAYYMGKLVLEAQFDGTIRVPALFDYTRDVSVKNIVVDVNAMSDRSLCHCPTWDDGKNHTSILPVFF